MPVMVRTSKRNSSSTVNLSEKPADAWQWQKLNGSNGMAFISDLHIKLTGVSKRGKITREDDISCKGKQKKMELRALLDSVIVRLTATQGS